MADTNDATAVAQSSTRSARPTAQEIQRWLVVHVAELLDIPTEQVEISAPLERFGLDSAAIVALTGDLAAWLKRDLDPNLAGEFPNIKSIAAFVGSADAAGP